MTKSFLRFLGVVALCAATLSACTKGTEEPAVALVLTAVPTSFEVGGNTTFTVKANDSDVTGQATITQKESGDVVENATWSSERPGTYTFYASYKGQNSEEVIVIVTEVAEPIAITLKASNNGDHTEIGVFAFDTAGELWADAATTATPNLLYNQTLTEEGAEWTYTPSVDYPTNTSHKTSFFAYAPLAAEGGVTISEATQTGAPVLSYDHADGTRTDIRIARAIDRSPSVEPVALEMRSVMAKVGFRLQGDGVKRVTKIALQGINEKGTIALDNTGTGSQDAWITNSQTSNLHEIGLAFDAGQEYVTAPTTMTNVTAADGYLYVLPQYLTNFARIVVTVDDKVIAFAVPSPELKPGIETLFDITIPGEIPFDWTDNASAALLVAPMDGNGGLVTTDWAGAVTECNVDGYHLPTYNELLLVGIYANGIQNVGFTQYRNYWSSTMLNTPMGIDGKQVLVLSFGAPREPFASSTLPGQMYPPEAGVRCVKAAEGGRVYPYVESNTDGPIIVSRDAQGGANPSSQVKNAWDDGYSTYTVFHDNWTTTPDHMPDSENNRISRKLQVANTDVGKVTFAGAICPTGWRVPTLMELKLIYATGGAQTTAYNGTSGSEFYNPAVGTALNTMSGFTAMNGNYWSKSATSGKGGATPVLFDFVETGMHGVATYDPELYANAALLRCVRDVE